MPFPLALLFLKGGAAAAGTGAAATGTGAAVATGATVAKGAALAAKGSGATGLLGMAGSGGPGLSALPTLPTLPLKPIAPLMPYPPSGQLPPGLLNRPAFGGSGMPPVGLGTNGGGPTQAISGQYNQQNPGQVNPLQETPEMLQSKMATQLQDVQAQTGKFTEGFNKASNPGLEDKIKGAVEKHTLKGRMEAGLKSVAPAFSMAGSAISAGSTYNVGGAALGGGLSGFASGGLLGGLIGMGTGALGAAQNLGALNNAKYNNFTQNLLVNRNDINQGNFFAKYGGYVDRSKIKKFGMGGFLEESGSGLVPIQAQKNEMIVAGDNMISKVKADRYHNQMSDDKVTDFLPEGSFIASDKVKIAKKDADNLSLGFSPISYGDTPERGETSNQKVTEITLGDLYNKGKKHMNAAELVTKVDKMMPLSTREGDAYSDLASSMNRNARTPYLQSILGLADPKAPNSGNLAKAARGLENISSYLDQSQKMLEQSHLNNLNYIRDSNRDANTYLTIGTAAGAMGLAAQDPRVDPTMVDPRYIQALPQSVPQYASNYAAYNVNQGAQPVIKSLFENTSNFNQAASILGGVGANVADAQSKIAMESVNKNLDLRNNYLMQMSNLSNIQQGEYAKAGNMTRDNINAKFAGLGSLGVNYGTQKASLALNKGNQLAQASQFQDSGMMNLMNSRAQLEIMNTMYGDRNDGGTPTRTTVVYPDHPNTGVPLQNAGNPLQPPIDPKFHSLPNSLITNGTQDGKRSPIGINDLRLGDNGRPVIGVSDPKGKIGGRLGFGVNPNSSSILPINNPSLIPNGGLQPKSGAYTPPVQFTNPGVNGAGVPVVPTPATPASSLAPTPATPRSTFGTFGPKDSAYDIVYNRAGNSMGFEQTMGGSSGNPLSNAGNPVLPDNVTKKEATEWYMNNIYPQVKDYSDSPNEQADAGDFLYNTGKSMKPYQLQEYLREQGGHDASWSWDGKNNPIKQDQEWKKFSKLDEATRRSYGSKARDWYYRLRFIDKLDKTTGKYLGTKGVTYWDKTKTPDPNKQYIKDGEWYYEKGPDGTLSPAYGKTWQYRVDNDQYEAYDQNKLVSRVNEKKKKKK